MENQMMSLYDYLGKAAGQKLGAEVNIAARNNNIPPQMREVSNSKYKGKVMLYPKWFLDDYFKVKPSDIDELFKADSNELPF